MAKKTPKKVRRSTRVLIAEGTAINARHSSTEDLIRGRRTLMLEAEMNEERIKQLAEELKSMRQAQESLLGHIDGLNALIDSRR